MVSGATGRGLEVRDVVEREEEADCAQERVRQLSADHGKGEGELLIRLCGALATEDEAAKVVFRLGLCEDKGGEDGRLEDDEDAVLQAGARAVELDVGEASEKGHGDVVKEAREAVVR